MPIKIQILKEEKIIQKRVQKKGEKSKGKSILKPNIKKIGIAYQKQGEN